MTFPPSSPNGVYLYMKIPKLYEGEISAGIIQHPSIIKAACPIKMGKKSGHNIKLPSAIAKANPDQLDLYYLNTILVSVGWNANDDIFSSEALWGGRNTPQDKPFNLEHQPEVIIGHITGNFMLDEEMEIIGDESFEELPEKFHLGTSAVIYKQMNKRNPELSETISTIIEEIDEGGKWFVSMECLFNDFDYGLIDSTGNHHIIARNEETSFLTKHMRSYGGDGTFKDFKIGRLVKNVIFSGKGLVQNPANAESIIFDKDSINQFNGVANTLEDVILDAKGDKKDMSDKTEKVLELEAEVVNLKNRLDKVGEEKVKGQLDSLAKVAEGAKSETEKVQVELKAANVKLDELKEEAKAHSDEKEALETKLSEAKKQLDEIASEAQKTQRISSLVDAGVDKKEAEELVAEKYADLDDNSFASVVDLHTQLIEAKSDDKNDKMKKDKEKEDKKDAKASEDLQDGQASDESLEDAEEEDNLDLNIEASNDQAELSEGIVAYLFANEK